MPAEIPFLTPDQRVEYLYERDYFPPGSLTEENRSQLEQINFHYFLGYARNYRMLVRRGLIPAKEKAPDDVFAVIEHDHRVSDLLYSGLRRAEWNLRRLAVEHYCQRFPSVKSFLKTEQYVETEEGSAHQLITSILHQILRHGEPYVVEHLRKKANEQGLARHKR